MNTKLFYRVLQVTLGITLLGIGGLAGYLVRMSTEAPPPTFSLLSEAHELVIGNYLDELPEEIDLQRGMIHGMVARLGDPFTTYVEPSSNELQQNNLAGRFGGIGATLSIDNDGRALLLPFSEGPAIDAGITTSVFLLEIDGIPIVPGMVPDEIIALIRGPVGSTVNLTLQDLAQDADPYELELVREEIEIPSVTSSIIDDIGLMRIERFSGRTPSEVSAAYAEFERGSVKAMIIDLRGNTGGLLDSATDVASYFLEEGVVLKERERNGVERVHEVKFPGQATTLPLVVLIDHQTASASEVLASALRDNGRGILIGETTYGKGSVQSILALSDGSSLHVTIARWLTPLGESIDGLGLAPDLPASGDPDSVLQMGMDELRNLMGEPS